MSVRKTTKKAVIGLGMTLMAGMLYVACSSCCVRAGSLVMTPDGLRPIEEIEVGDSVLSFDVGTGAWVPNQVEGTYAKVGLSWIAATFADGSVLETTADHECYDAKARDYMPIQGVGAFLRVGEDAATSADATRRRAYGLGTFHDLRLRGEPHTYVANGVVVHNKGGGGGGGTDTSAIAGTYTLVSGSSTNSLGDTVVFTTGTLTIGTAGTWNMTSNGTTNAPGAVNPVSSTANDVFSAGSGRGPFSGTYAGRDRDSGTYNEPTTGTFSNVTVDTNGLLTGTYSGSTTGNITFNGTLTCQGPAQADLGALLNLNSANPHAAQSVVQYYFEVSQPNGNTNQQIRVGVYLSTDATITTADTLVNSHPITTNAGTIVFLTANFTLPAGVTGVRFLGVIVDDQNVVSESNENNNTDSEQLTIN